MARPSRVARLREGSPKREHISPAAFVKGCNDHYSEAKNAKHCGVGVDSPGRGASIAIAGLYDASALGARHEFGRADAEQITTRKSTSDDEAHTGLKYMNPLIRRAVVGFHIDDRRSVAGSV